MGRHAHYEEKIRIDIASKSANEDVLFIKGYNRCTQRRGDLVLLVGFTEEAQGERFGLYRSRCW